MWRKGCQILVKCALRPMHSTGHVHEALLQCYFFHSFSLGPSDWSFHGQWSQGGIWVSEVQQGIHANTCQSTWFLCHICHSMSFWIMSANIDQFNFTGFHRLHRTLLLGIFVSYAECIRVFFLRQWNVASAWIHSWDSYSSCSMLFLHKFLRHIHPSSIIWVTPQGPPTMWSMCYYPGPLGDWGTLSVYNLLRHPPCSHLNASIALAIAKLS